MMRTPCVPVIGRLALIALAGGLAATAGLAQETRVNVTFSSQNRDRAFDAAADEYRRIWAAEGSRILEAMERISTLRFPETRVKVEIYEGPSLAGLRINRQGVPVGTRGPILLRASYASDVKQGTLVHELGHRMNVQLKKRPPDLDEHRLLFLWLYDLYEDLYGSAFADAQVAFGRRLKGLYDYDAAWNWTLAMSRAERASRFAAVLKANRK